MARYEECVKTIAINTNDPSTETCGRWMETGHSSLVYPSQADGLSALILTLSRPSVFRTRRSGFRIARLRFAVARLPSGACRSARRRNFDPARSLRPDFNVPSQGSIGIRPKLTRQLIANCRGLAGYVIRGERTLSAPQLGPALLDLGQFDGV